MPETLAQVIESSIGWANGDLDPSEMLAAEQCSSGAPLGDQLRQFLLLECGLQDDYGRRKVPNDLAAWTVARSRVRQVLAEVQAVHDALHAYGPQA